MTFPYRQVFEQVEESLIRYGSRHLAPERIRAELDVYKNVADRKLADDLCYSLLRDVVFYSGFRAATVTARMEAIKRWFPDSRTSAEYGNDDVARIMSDSRMIRNRRKICACIENARIMRNLIEECGSFEQYLASFAPGDSFENLLLLKEELEARFHFLGGVTVYHFLTDLGLSVLKPDRVICRIFTRLGITNSEGQLLSTVIQGRKFAEATGLPIRYVDIVFVAYGQSRSLEFGVDRGICLKRPRCGICELNSFCPWYKDSSHHVEIAS